MRPINKNTNQFLTNLTNVPPQNCSCNTNLTNCTCCLVFTTQTFNCVNSTKYDATCLPFYNLTSKINSLLCNYTNVTNKLLSPDNCSCINITVNGKNQLNCSCCVKNEIVPIVPVFRCANNTETVNCSCRNVTSFDKKSWSYTCDCLRRIDKSTIEAVANITSLTPQNCSCPNSNFSTCTCCLAFTTKVYTCGANTTRVNATCLPFYNLTSKLNQLSCNFTNATNKALFPENCTCANLTINGKNQLNCTCCLKNETKVDIPIPVQTNITCDKYYRKSPCKCTNVTVGKSWTYNCDCNVTNSTMTVQKTALSFTSTQCGCLSMLNWFNCSCCVYSPPPVIIDDTSCDSANKPNKPVVTPNATNCKNEYEYLVAVVATGTNSSVLF